MSVASAGVALTAILRVGAHAGIVAGTPKELTIGDDKFSVRSGIEVGVWVDAAEFEINVLTAPDTSECELEVVEAYSMNVGADAGATLAVDSHTVSNFQLISLVRLHQSP